MKKIRILSLDPGTVNYGWSLIEVYRRRTRVVRCGMMHGMLKGLVEPLQDDVRGYSAVMGRLLRKARPDVLCSERYSTRIRGTTGEAVNIMTGIALKQFHEATPSGPIVLYMSMSWKAHAKKWLGGEIKPYYKVCGIPPHPVDACLLAHYWCYRTWGMTWPTPASLARQINKAYIEF